MTTNNPASWAARTARDRPAPGTHTCAVRGCTVTVAARYLMCAPHWRRVPAAIQTRLWAAYQPGQTALTASPEYRDAMRDAIDAVAQAQEAR